MALEIKLSQKLSQSLVMTPQLQQAIKLLQLGRMEYMEVIEKELLENPCLEDIREESREGAPQQPADEQPAQKQSKEESDLASYLDLHSDSYSSSFGTARRGDFDDERPSLEQTVSSPEGLSSHLMWQLRTSDLSNDDKEIGLLIIGNLDRNGYLASSTAELAEESHQSIEDVEKVLGVVQTFDPPGIAARDLGECLRIQLDQMGMGESLAYSICEKHLEKLESRRYDAIAKQEGADLDEVYTAVKQIQKLEPRPGRPFVDETPIYITPDIFVKKVGDEWVLSLNEAGMPKLRLNPEYKDRLQKVSSQNEKEYLQDKLKGASWLIKSIHQRQQTIFKVASSIMKFQREFLDTGIAAMKPLVLRDVAEDVEMHESTVSRVTTNKYIHTPHGVFELKFFFSSGLKTGSGEVSSESVKERIRDLIAAEDPKHPLSDQAIVETLKKEGVDIARRTVAKYREMMNILSSAQRKKVF